MASNVIIKVLIRILNKVVINFGVTRQIIHSILLNRAFKSLFAAKLYLNINSNSDNYQIDSI